MTMSLRQLAQLNIPQIDQLNIAPKYNPTNLKGSEVARNIALRLRIHSKTNMNSVNGSQLFGLNKNNQKQPNGGDSSDVIRWHTLYGNRNAL
jgi:hypothetical protein